MSLPGIKGRRSSSHHHPVDNHETQGVQVALPNKPQQPPLDTEYDYLSSGMSDIENRSDNVGPESSVTIKGTYEA